MKNKNVTEVNETIDRIITKMDNMDKRLDGIIEILDSMKKTINESNKQANTILRLGERKLFTRK